jgi:hypothetical protein
MVKGKARTGIALALACVIAVACVSHPGETAANAVRAWISEMAGATVDRGWSKLSDKAKATYEGDESAYRVDVESVRWSAVQWTIDNAFDNDGTWIVLVGVEGGWDAVPQFIRQRPLAHIYCDNGAPAGFAVGVTFEGSAETATIHPGVRTGDAAIGQC